MCNACRSILLHNNGIITNARGEDVRCVALLRNEAKHAIVTRRVDNALFFLRYIETFVTDNQSILSAACLYTSLICAAELVAADRTL
jgi:hypothetical protein